MNGADIEKMLRKMYDSQHDQPTPYICHKSPCDQLPAAIEADIRLLIPIVRERLLDNVIGRNMSDDYYERKGYYQGFRFNSDSDVISGIQGGSTGDPSYFSTWSYTEMITAALMNAASRDHWYTFEKSY